MKKKIFVLLGIIALFHFKIFAQNFYSIDTIQRIEVSFFQSNWDYILDTAKQGSDSYTMSKWVKVNGVQFDSAGVKYKGNSSYNPANAKNPLHIELDHFKSQNYLGYKDIKLSNGYHEPSSIREVMSYSILQNYMKASHANFAQVNINGQLMGLYTNVEAVTNTFLENRFYSNNNTFIFADNGGCDLRYKGNDSLQYKVPYTKKSDFGLTDLMHLCDTLKNHITEIENILDVDRTLWMLSFTNALVTLDSYLGNSKHNYYLYQDDNGRFNPIIWDLNGGLGIFNKPDFGVSLTTSQMQNLSPMLHGNDSMWPLMKNIIAVPMYKRMYIAHMKTIIKENIENSSYLNFALYLQTIVDTMVLSDPMAFYTHSQFLSNITSTIVDGPKIIPGITELMDARATYLNSTTEFQQIPPTISNIQASNSFPPINSNIYITTSINNAVNVYLGLRSSVIEKFTRNLMYDDGLHGDGSAGDGTYGVLVPVNSPEIQYYIYAENNNAGLFSPERAENEYYSIDADYAVISAGDVVINEIMAINNTTNINASGIYGDWVELYNTTSNAISLNNLNLSDDASSPSKWQFPTGTIIQPHGFQIIWADDIITSLSELHCNFKLSGSGEQVVISYSNGYVVDSISFPTQTADITWGRYPNGTGPFVFMPPTNNATNIYSGINDFDNKNNTVKIFPNPVSELCTISIFEKEPLIKIEIYNILGGLVKEFNFCNTNTVDLDLSCLTKGIFTVTISTKNQLTTRKIIKI